MKARTVSETEMTERLGRVSSSQIGDAMDRLNLMDSGLSRIGSPLVMVGRAFPVQTAAGDNKIIHQAIEHLQTGEILVVDGQGATTRALIGELIAERYQRAGCAGFIIDGAVRDAEEISGLRFPVYARAVTPAGPYRHGPGRMQQAVSAGGVVVHPGDWIVGDADGIAVIPRSEADDILERAESKREQERRQQEEIRSESWL